MQWPVLTIFLQFCAGHEEPDGYETIWWQECSKCRIGGFEKIQKGYELISGWQTLGI